MRWDSHIQVGYSVPPYYDSLLGKLIVHAPTRLEALATMRRALDELVIEGVQTTIPLHRRILRNPDFIAGRVDTTWVERVLLPPRIEPPSPTERRAARAAVLRRSSACGHLAESAAGMSPLILGGDLGWPSACR